jgi:hypothetical protein
MGAGVSRNEVAAADAKQRAGRRSNRDPSGACCVALSYDVHTSWIRAFFVENWSADVADANCASIRSVWLARTLAGSGAASGALGIAAVGEVFAGPSLHDEMNTAAVTTSAEAEIFTGSTPATSTGRAFAPTEADDAEASASPSLLRLSFPRPWRLSHQNTESSRAGRSTCSRGRTSSVLARVTLDKLEKSGQIRINPPVETP